MAQESGIETPTAEDLARFDRKRRGRTLSNADWKGPTEPDARSARMRDGTTQLAYKPEHAVDLDTGIVVAAPKLIPRTHGFGRRRVPLERAYFEVYNQPDVKLIDLAETPIEQITPKGICTSDADYPLDMIIYIIYATWFDAITEAFDCIHIRGVDGQSLKDEWAEGPVPLLGNPVDGFANFTMVMGPHASLGDFPRAAEYKSDWVTAPIGHARDKRITRLDATSTAAKASTDHVVGTNEALLFNEGDSWMSGINPNVEGK